MQERAVGIDLGASTIWLVVVERVSPGRPWSVTGGACIAADDLAAVTEACRGATVAIDAPGGPSEGLHLDDDRVAGKFRTGRCAEVGLRLAGHAVSWITPADAAPTPGWMRVGFDVWRAAEASARSVLEVFPHAVFAVLHGSRPASKQTVAGRRARLAALRRELVLPAGTDLWSHDAIDAAGAAVVAAHHLQGRAVPAACGRHEAGVMWLPEASPPHPDTVDR